MQVEEHESKQVVTRVTIEGEHTYVLVLRATRLELLPISNAPHQNAIFTIEYSALQFV